MDEFTARIEALEHQFMRSWMNRDRNGMKAMASADFVFLLGAQTAAMLDRPSWLEAATTRFQLSAYRFKDLYVRKHKKMAVFAARMSIEARIGSETIDGDVWITDLWQRGRLRRRWKLVERTLSRPTKNEKLPGLIKEMQLWR
ncbi:hypothetical protein BPTFM16_00961 [Altererythrobacter insulae]|nr:hypothetical protein BPTFM16_00961 [Altererythrobacter insulae]